MTMPPKPAVPTASGRSAALAIGGILVALLIPYTGYQVLEWTTGAATRHTHHTYTQPVQRVDVEVGSGDVTVTRAAGPAVVVDNRLRGSLRPPRVDERLSAGTLSVRGRCGLVWGRCDVSVTVAVPRGVAVDLTASSGDVSATGVAGSATLTTSSGDIEAKGVDGPLRMTASSGDIVAEGLDAPRVTGTTSSGDVTLVFADAPRHVAAETSSGDATVVVPSGPQSYDVTADTSSGDRVVRLRTDPGSSRSIDARTSSGDVTVAAR